MTPSGYFMHQTKPFFLQPIEDAIDNWDDNSWNKDSSKYGISVINHPMNFTEKQLNEKNM